MRIQRHDYLKQLLANCLKQATTTQSVQMEQPIILPPRVNRANAANNNSQVAAGTGPSRRDPRMDIRVKGLRGLGETDDVDIRITHLDCPSYIASGHDVETLFDEHHVKPKRAMYEEACRRLRHQFTPFVVSTDGVMSDPAKEFFKLLADKTAEKWGADSAGKRGVIVAHLRAKIGAAIVRGASWCIRGEREGQGGVLARRGIEVNRGDRVELRHVHSSQASGREY